MAMMFHCIFSRYVALYMLALFVIIQYGWKAILCNIFRPSHEREPFMNGLAHSLQPRKIRLDRASGARPGQFIREIRSGDEQRHLVGIPR